MLVVHRGRVGVDRTVVGRLEHEARRTELAALLADNLHAAHGADVRADIPDAETGGRMGAGETNRGIRSDLVGHAGRVADGGGNLVAHDAGRRRLFCVRAGAARKEQLVLLLVLAREEQVGAGVVSGNPARGKLDPPFRAEAEEDLLVGVLVLGVGGGGGGHGGGGGGGGGGTGWIGTGCFAQGVRVGIWVLVARRKVSRSEASGERLKDCRQTFL
jgi:hypothetical protein